MLVQALVIVYVPSHLVGNSKGYRYIHNGLRMVRELWYGWAKLCQIWITYLLLKHVLSVRQVRLLRHKRLLQVLLE